MNMQKRGEEVKETEPIHREWQRGTSWLATGIILLAFDVMFVMIFIPSDLRAGGDFWTTVCGIVTFVALVLIVAGLLTKRGAALERAAEENR